MTAITLSDGTKVPEHYDFNGRFEPLVVKNQGQQGICWWETRCTMLEAFWRMYTDKAPTFDPHQLGVDNENWQFSNWTDERFDPPRPLGRLTYVGGTHIPELPEFKGLTPREAIMKALYFNGVVEGGTKAEQSLNRLYAKPWKYEGWNERKNRFSTLPVLSILPGDIGAIQRNNWSHSVIYVGYDAGLGVIFQNSWGGGFGKGGRAIFSWEMVEKQIEETWDPGRFTTVCQPGLCWSFNDFPAHGLKMPKAA